MSVTSTDLLSRGEELLAASDWAGARDAFAELVEQEGTPAAHDGLGRALWWLRDLDGAFEHRGRAYAGFRSGGQLAPAARIALWLAIEYAEAAGNEPVSRGWIARAEGLVRELGPTSAQAGWLAATKARLEVRPASGLAHAEEALGISRSVQDPDLEATALALVGLAMLDAGDVGAGLDRLDEAMVVATGGEVTEPIVFGDVCCLATRAAEEAGEVDRLMRWNEVVMSFMERSGHAALLEFCGTCCAEVLAANGQLDEAEGWLARTLAELEGTGHRARCVHPAAKFAELRLLQGRVEEAQRLLEGYEDHPDALRAVARLHLARGETAVAASLLHRRLNQVGDGLLAVPLLALLLEVQVAQGDLDTARASAERLVGIAERSARPRQRASADLALGRVLSARGDPRARERLAGAIQVFSAAQMPLEAAEARLELASFLRDAEREVAIHEARLAQEAAETAGAVPLADRAAALVRELGGPARTGPKLVGTLSKRELEVLRLLGEGLSNAEIAARLYISTKTAGNHVSNVLAKLGVRNRAEAAALAVRSGLEPVP